MEFAFPGNFLDRETFFLAEDRVSDGIICNGFWDLLVPSDLSLMFRVCRSLPHAARSCCSSSYFADTLALTPDVQIPE